MYVPICLQIKGSIVTDNKIIANKFNNFFNSIATKIDSKTGFILSIFLGPLHSKNTKS